VGAPRPRTEVLAVLIADEMRALRGARTHREAADLLGIARPNLRRHESGAHEPTLSTIVRNVKALGGDPLEVVARVLARLDDPSIPAPHVEVRPGSQRTPRVRLPSRPPEPRAKPGVTVSVTIPVPAPKRGTGFALPERKRP